MPSAGAPATTAGSLPRDAQAVVDGLVQAVPTARQGFVVTAENDSNKMLGRPNGYTSKVAFVDSRVKESGDDAATGGVGAGGSVEVFPTAQGATFRRDYIQGIAQRVSFADEYDYLAGSVLLRVSHELTPAQASEYEAALKRVADS